MDADPHVFTIDVAFTTHRPVHPDTDWVAASLYATQWVASRPGVVMPTRATVISGPLYERTPMPTRDPYAVYRLNHGIDACRHRADVETRWAIACAVAALIAVYGAVAAARGHSTAWAALAVLVMVANVLAAWRSWRSAAKWRQA